MFYAKWHLVDRVRIAYRWEGVTTSQ